MPLPVRAQTRSSEDPLVWFQPLSTSTGVFGRIEKHEGVKPEISQVTRIIMSVINVEIAYHQ